MRKQKIIIQQIQKENNSLEIESLARFNDSSLLEAIIEWLEDKDIDIFDFKEYVSDVLIDRLKQECIKNNVVKDDLSHRKSNLHQLFLEL